MTRQEGPLNVTESGGDILIGINYHVPIDLWPEEAIDRLITDLQATTEDDDEPPPADPQFVRPFTAAEDALLEVRRDAALKIEELERELRIEQQMNRVLIAAVIVFALAAITAIFKICVT